MDWKRMVAVLPFVALSGCGAGAPEPAPTTTVTETATATATVTATSTVTVTPTPTPTPSFGQGPDANTTPVVRDVEDLRARLVGVGLVCSGWEAIGEIGGTCDGGIMLSAFPGDSPESRNAHRAGVNLALLTINTQDRPDVALLVGPNWFVRADVDGAYELRSLIGGAVVGMAG